MEKNIYQPVNYLDFNNPIHVTWRAGTPTDPFVDRVDITKVVNQRISLLEIPDELYRARIAGMFEINYEKFVKNSLAENEFYCDYTNGMIYFNKIKEAETITIVYKGRGVILYPSTRILHYDGTDSTQTLYEIIEESKDLILDLANKTQTFEEVLEKMIIATNNTVDVTNQAIEVTDEAKRQIELIQDAYDTTVLIYQPYVNTYNDIATTYPNPSVGWTVQVYDSGIRYRWNGQNWVPIDALGGNIPIATENYNGLMPKEAVTKLKTVGLNINTRVPIFIIPQQVLQGVQDPHIPIPFNGKVKSIKATVSEAGTTETNIRVEKTTDFSGWNLVGTVKINAGENFDDGASIIANSLVASGEIFRLNVLLPDTDILNLTVSVEVEVE